MNFDLPTILNKADEVFTFLDDLSPEIPQYGPIVSVVAKIGKAVIADEPVAVALFIQVVNTVKGGTPLTDAQLEQWAAQTDVAGASLDAHIAEQLKAAGAG